MNVQSFYRIYWISLVLFLVIISINPVLAHDTRNMNNQTGFLVLTADRGFVGNEEIREAFHILAQGHNAALVFITDERTEKYLKLSLGTLLNKGAERIVVIPLFISTATPRLDLARKLLAQQALVVPVSYARAYGDSYFAVEDLADKFRAINYTKDTAALIVGYGATDNDSKQKMQEHLQRIADQAAKGFDFASVQVLVAYEKNSGDDVQHAAELKQTLANFHGAQATTDGASKRIVIPFHFGPKLDSMMSFDTRLKQYLPADNLWLPDDKLDKRLVAWLQREVNKNLPLATKDIGVVFLAHGADFNWNEEMREAVKPLMRHYKIEFAFSMADQSTIQHAIDKLEQRGAQAVVIVRAFAMEESFRSTIERMIGLDIEKEMHYSIRDVAYTHHDEMHYGEKKNPLPRIRTSLPIRTAGGLGASPLFATALYERARALSGAPERETVILVGHGSRSDHHNKQWKETLEIIASHMRQIKGNEFKSIQVATWREDWPDKSAPWVKKIRTIIEAAKQRGGDVIVVPARITGQGRENEFLAGLDYKLGAGFAPHPLFVRWVSEQIETGIAQLDQQ